MNSLSRLRLRGCSRVGKGPEVDGAPFIENLGRIEIGASFRLSSRPTRSHLVTGVGGRLCIGDGVTIAHGASISARTAIELGDGVRIGPFVSLLDNDFHEPGNLDAAGRSSAIAIGRGATLGARVTVLRGSRIGEGARVDAGSVVRGSIAAFAHVGGVPARAHGAAGGAGGQGARSDGAPWRAPLERVVLETVRRALGLALVPALSDGPLQLPGWDAPGILRVLMSLEEELGVTLDAAALGRVGSLAELERAVRAAELARAALPGAAPPAQ